MENANATKKYCVIINSKSGSGSKDELLASIRASFEKYAVTADIIEIEPEADIGKAIQQAINKDNLNDRIIVVAGGDGTINAVAQHCIPQNLTMGLIPLGTFNYFARNFDFPLTIPEAVDTIIKNHTIKTTVGKAGEYYFLNNASLGLYKEIIENRENDKSILGRSRFVALISAVFTLLSSRKLLHVKLKTNGTTVTRKTSLLFIGSNAFQLKNLGMSMAICVDRNLLAVSILRQISMMQMVKLLAKGAVKMLDNESNLEQFCTEELVIELNKKWSHVVIDGEIVTCSIPLKIEACPEALNLIIPAPRENT